MAKLYFKYGAMGAGKSIDIVRCNYSYLQRGMQPLCLKSAVDTRDSTSEVVSRPGLSAKARLISATDNLIHIFLENKECDIILIDEAQFLASIQIEQLRTIVDKYGTPVICYGLKTNFQSYTFEGSKRLLEIADSISEIENICWCGKKATMNARLINGEMVTEGELIVMGADESYTALCAKHYFEKQIKKAAT